MPELKLTPKKRKEIYNWKEMKGQPLPNNPKKRISAYTVAKIYRISHTYVYKIWKEGPEASIKTTNSIDTEILKDLIPVFIEHELKVDLDPKKSLRVDELVKEVMSQ